MKRKVKCEAEIIGKKNSQQTPPKAINHFNRLEYHKFSSIFLSFFLLYLHISFCFIRCVCVSYIRERPYHNIKTFAIVLCLSFAGVRACVCESRVFFFVLLPPTFSPFIRDANKKTLKSRKNIYQLSLFIKCCRIINASDLILYYSNERKTLDRKKERRDVTGRMVLVRVIQMNVNGVWEWVVWHIKSV